MGYIEGMERHEAENDLPREVDLTVERFFKVNGSLMFAIQEIAPDAWQVVYHADYADARRQGVVGQVIGSGEHIGIAVAICLKVSAIPMPFLVDSARTVAGMAARMHREETGQAGLWVQPMPPDGLGPIPLCVDCVSARIEGGETLRVAKYNAASKCADCRGANQRKGLRAGPDAA